MRLTRTIPPAAAPVRWRDLAWALAGFFTPRRTVASRQHELREFFGVRHVVLASSGTAALTLTLEALKRISNRTDVVIPAYTCPSVPAAVLKANLRPVLCDVDPRTFDFDYGRLEHVLGDNTLAIVAHHPFGVPANVDRIRSHARRHGVLVVEDAAQAMGVVTNRRRVGTLGDVGIFSLGRGKSITCGSGGIVVTSSEGIGRALQATAATLEAPTFLDALKQLVVLAGMTAFLHPSLYWLPASLPFLRLGQTIYPKDIELKRLSGLQAGFLRRWRDRLAEAAMVRSDAVSYFQRELRLASPTMPYSRLPILLANAAERDRLYRLSNERGLGLGIGYPTPVNEIPEIRQLFSAERYPGAEKLVACLVTLPTHHHLSDRDKHALADCLRTSTGARTPSREWRKAS